MWKVAPLESRSSPNDAVVLCLPLTRTLIACADRTFETNNNNLCVFDAREPHTSHALEAINSIGLVVPRGSLAQRIPICKEAVNRPLPLAGDVALLANFMRSLARVGPSTLSPAARIMAGEQVLDLAALALGSIAGVTPKLASSDRIMVLRLRMAVEEQLTDPTATRRSIAAAAGMSERHANRLLAEGGTSITELLRKQRLAKCRDVLEDRDQRHRQINNIAHDFGFRDPAVFSHAFKRRFGVSATEYRYSVLRRQK